MMNIKIQKAVYKNIIHTKLFTIFVKCLGYEMMKHGICHTCKWHAMPMFFLKHVSLKIIYSNRVYFNTNLIFHNKFF